MNYLTTVNEKKQADKESKRAKAEHDELVNALQDIKAVLEKILAALDTKKD